jgi:hypothetical protein
MMLVQIDSELVTELLVTSHGILEQPFLQVARKVRPQLERGLPNS